MKKVISMSRRTDMRWSADKLIPVLRDKYPPEKVHTVVCWTKFPRCVYNEPYAGVLEKYDQVYVHVTATGLGGSSLEPNVPAWREALRDLKELAAFLKTPERMRVRVDPLVILRREGGVITNISVAEQIIGQAADMGITVFSTSFMEEYPKVRRRLSGHGYEIITLSQNKRVKMVNQLRKIAVSHGGRLYTCAVPGLATSRCIDGPLLQKLHPKKEPCSIKKAAGQRELCGCSESTDIGWYSMYCRSGCLYCYAGG
ncbi:MAG: DUF1848 domain-containing protein [Firmicutes bacterium]|nr:DUF1848 domain-containing protein [Bacillota bacterium]